jgi:hypothetical protein
LVHYYYNNYRRDFQKKVMGSQLGEAKPSSPSTVRRSRPGLPSCVVPRTNGISHGGQRLCRSIRGDGSEPVSKLPEQTVAIDQRFGTGPASALVLV